MDRKSASFDQHTGVLTLNDVEIGDEAAYLCNVGFKNYPTLTYTANLTVLGRQLIILAC